MTASVVNIGKPTYTFFEMDAPQFDPTKAQTKGKIFILDKDLTGDGKVNGYLI